MNTDMHPIVNIAIWLNDLKLMSSPSHDVLMFGIDNSGFTPLQYPVVDKR